MPKITSRNEGDQQTITVTETLGEVLGLPDDVIDPTIGDLVRAGRLKILNLGDGVQIIAWSSAP